MASFKDKKNRVWEITITDEAAAHLKAELPSVDLAENPITTARLMADDIALMCETIWLLCYSSAIERGVTQRDFYLHVLQHAIPEATKAFLAALSDYGRQRQTTTTTEGA